MANNGFLINSSTLASDPAEIQRLRGQPGHIDGVVAESSNRLLIPWFLCFRQPDLRPVPYNSVEIQLPVTAVEQAVCNMEQALPIFEAIAGSAALAKPRERLGPWCTKNGFGRAGVRLSLLRRGARLPT